MAVVLFLIMKEKVRKHDCITRQDGLPGAALH